VADDNLNTRIICFKYRLRPTKAQRKRFSEILEQKRLENLNYYQKNSVYYLNKEVVFSSSWKKRHLSPIWTTRESIISKTENVFLRPIRGADKGRKPLGIIKSTTKNIMMLILMNSRLHQKNIETSIGKKLNSVLLRERMVFPKKYMRICLKNREILVLFVFINLIFQEEKKFTLTIAISRNKFEDCYVIDAIDQSDFLVMMLRFLKAQLNILNNIHNGLASGMLAKSVNDASWGKLREYLTYKAANAGRNLIAVDPRHTSQDCSSCGIRVIKSLAVRTHHCPACGLVLDRDENAARNILAGAVVASLVGERSGVPQASDRNYHAKGISK
jgi:transposase